MRKVIIYFFSCLMSISSYGQDEEVYLTFADYIEIVKSNHPVFFQAGLRSDMIESTRKMARGGFDPKLEAP